MVRLVAQRAHVYLLSSSLHEEQLQIIKIKLLQKKQKEYSIDADLVEGFENVDPGLMDGADDGPARVHGVPDRPHHDGRRPSVQSGSGLVYEDDRRVGYELHCDGQPLPLLRRQPVDPGKPHDGPPQERQFHKLHHLFDEHLSRTEVRLQNFSLYRRTADSQLTFLVAEFTSAGSRSQAENRIDS